MLFSSNLFLFGFLPFTLIVYFLLLAKAPLGLRNGFLFLMSLFFYAWGEPVYVFLLLGVILVNWLCALCLARARSFALFVALCFNIGLLFSLKYVAFFITTLNQMMGWQLNVPEQTLPIGLSFFLFQAISYVVDVYRGLCQAAKNPCEVGLYLAFFPQLAAGPIVRYNSIAAQIKVRRHCWQDISAGLCCFVVGLGAKVLLADQLADMADKAFALAAGQRTDLAIFMAWLGAIAFMLQIYFDFVGYSHMAIGLARVFGFELPENFRQPYRATCITDFWRRWHISLSSWFREYVYIPLGGNRVGKVKLYRNIFIVWLLTGIWHGASWNFLCWGLYFALLLMIEKAFLLKLLAKIPLFFRHCYALILVIVSWVIFALTDMGQVISYLQTMFGLNGAPLIDGSALYYLRNYGPSLLIMVIASTPLFKQLWQKQPLPRQQRLAPLLTLLGLILATAYLVSASYNPFLYFRF